MISANQLYKMSKSSLTFKEWLKDNQNKGLLDNHDLMYNLIDGQEDEKNSQETIYSTTNPSKPTTQKSFTQLTFVNIVALIGIGILIYGLSKSSNTAN